MRFITAKSETNLADLTRRVFDIKGAKASEVAKRAEAAIRQANPHLHDLTNVPAGTLIVVPDLPGADPAAPQAAPLLSPEVATQLKHALAGARAVLERSAASVTQEAQNTAALVKSREVKALAKEAPLLERRLPQIAEQIKAQARQAATDKTAQEQDLAQLEKELASLLA